jgi:hypothetical protein
MTAMCNPFQAISRVAMTDSSTGGIKTVLHPVSDLATAKAVYTARLGVPPQTARPTTSASRPRASTSDEAGLPRLTTMGR